MFKKLILKMDTPRVADILRKIVPYLDMQEKILDIGSGSCSVAAGLMKSGYNVTTLDVKNKSIIEGYSPIIYDGVELPFKEDQFDIGLLITVLHHTKNPENLIEEALRVCNKVLIMEDTYTSTAQKYLTFIMDSFFNLEFFGHPHSNKTDKEWKQYFKDKGFTLISDSSENFYKIFTSSLYVVTK